MGKKNVILLISDDEQFFIKLRRKLVFLRRDDCIDSSNYSSSLSKIDAAQTKVVLVHENKNKDKTIKLIEKIKKKFNHISQVLVADNYEADFILAAYEAGIYDFVMSSAKSFEFVIRIINTMKINTMEKTSLRDTRLLIQSGVVDELTGLYSHKFSKNVIENEVNYNLTDKGVFIAAEPSEASKKGFSTEKMAAALKKSLRANDTATLAKGAKFYILLPETDYNGAVKVVEKINHNFGKDFKLKAGIADISGKSFNKYEKEALIALSEAAYSKEDCIFSEDKSQTLDEWLDEDSSKEKNYKLFKQIFNKKLEKVIAPVFFRLQKSYEEKLFQTKIEQFTDSEQYVFTLQNKKLTSSLKIVYPGFAKIVIYINHKGLDSPENTEISYPLTKITQKELINIIENFIKDFKRTAIDR